MLKTVDSSRSVAEQQGSDVPRGVVESKTVAVQTALAKEAALFFELPGDKPRTEYGITWALRTIGTAHLVVAHGGMGKVNAAATAQFLVDRFSPEILVFSGIAGGVNPRLGMGDVVVGARTEMLDANMAIIAEDEPHLESFTSENRLVTLACTELTSRGFERVASVEDEPPQEGEPLGSTDLHVPRFVCGAISTSDLFNTDQHTLHRLRLAYRVDCEEMEGAAAAQVAARAGIGFLAVRSLSNICGEAYDDLDERTTDLVATSRLAADIVLATLKRYLDV